MRLESRKKIDIRGAVIGAARPLICLPMVAGDSQDLLAEAAGLVRLGPDLLEWRFDAYAGAADPESTTDLLPRLRAVIGNLPLIFTCRCPEEGGQGELSAEIRLAQVQAALASDLVDLVDVEMCNEAVFIDAVREAARAAGVQLILSHHDFNATPAEGKIIATLTKAQRLGAQIAKLAVMPRDEADVLTLLTATLKARQAHLEIPMITIAMAHLGLVSRVAGGCFGSDVTFASGAAASAPGQIPIAALRQAMAPLYLETESIF